MKQFFGAFFGSIVGIVVAVLLATLLVIGAVKASMSNIFKGKSESTATVGDKSILKLQLDDEIVERERENPFEEFGKAPFVEEAGLGLHSLIAKIRTAAKDERIKGIYLCFEDMKARYASLRELRQALLEFKKSGKFLYAYAEDYSQADYYLASAADRVFINPQGNLQWKGLGIGIAFFKHALEKLELEMQIFRHGRFKSAVEPLMLDKLSDANRMQSEMFLNGIWSTMIGEIAESRKVTVATLDSMANTLAIRTPEDAMGTLVDQLAYEDEVMDALRKKAGVTDKKKMPFVDVHKYHAKQDGAVGADKVAVIYADGQIFSGEGRDEDVGSIPITKAIRDARNDEKVKAIVLRVNSPGGSALASDVIWREVELARKAKPTVVSMGDVAASGGYYISCGADRIFAQPNTITGSIGVFGMLPNFRKLFENKLGVTVDTVNTNRYSDFGSTFRPVTEKEREYIQASVEHVYSTFTSRVAQGRKMAQADVDSIGQGRVWAGADALRLGLVDELGGLQDAVSYAAKKAKLSSYRIQEYPKLKGPFDAFFGNAEKEASERVMSAQLGKAYPYFKHLRSLMEMEGVQARLPFDIIMQ